MTLPCPQKSTFTIRQVTFCLIGSLPLLGLAACASGPKKLAVCNGHHLRDVNIYGSVLPGSPVPATTAPRPAPPIPSLSHPQVGDPPPPPAVPAPPDDKVSFAPRDIRYASC